MINIYDYFFVTEKIKLGSTYIDYIKTSHDANDSRGYIFEEDNTSVVYITDTGYINTKYYPKLENKSLYIMESNHDIELLMNGRYPYPLKQRILGDKGHLSNKDSAYYLSKLIGNDTKRIILAHLSEENNTPDLAYQTLNEVLKNINKDDIEIIVAKQNERTDLIEV
jgi:phosphoribosyl 1,2-cyclic phosphodiesterase